MLYFLCVVSLVSAIPANNLQSSTLVADSESCSWTRPCLGDSLECKFVQVCSNTSTSSNTNENLVSGQAFVIDFKCAPSVPEILCLKAQATIISASKRIEKVLVIQNTIRVQATFRPFCNGVSTGCQFDNTLGQAAPAAYFSAHPVSVSNYWYFYPQALIKQLSYNQKLNFNTYDIIADFNSEFSFYYPGDNTTIQSNQTDFEFVVAHELTHGLGFDTAWAQFGSLFSSIAGSANYLTPLPFTTGSTISTATVLNWQPMTIFDAFTKDSTGSVMNYAKGIFKYNKPKTDLSSFIKGFESSGAPFQSAQSFYRVVTSGTPLTFEIPSNSGFSSIILSTSSKYSSGSSIAHVDYNTYSNTPDFLMIPAIQSLTGRTLDQIINDNTLGGTISPQLVYGPKTLLVLQNLGYQIQGGNASEEIVVNLKPELSPLINGCEGMFGFGFLGFVLILMEI